jgi:hypothetical protein
MPSHVSPRRRTTVAAPPAPPPHHRRTTAAPPPHHCRTTARTTAAPHPATTAAPPPHHRRTTPCHHRLPPGRRYVLCDELSVEEGVTSLDFSRSGITSTQATLLAGALKGNTELTSLDLYRQLEAPSASDLATALQANTILAWLNLDGYELNLAQLRGTEPVEALDFSGKGIGAASGTVRTDPDQDRVLTRRPARPLAPRPALRLAPCPPRAPHAHGPPRPAAQVIARLLESNTSLQLLDMSYNARLGVATGHAIARTLSVNVSLTKLDVRGTHLPGGAIQAIGEALIGARASKLAMLGVHTATAIRLSHGARAAEP